MSLQCCGFFSKARSRLLLESLFALRSFLSACTLSHSRGCTLRYSPKFQHLNMVVPPHRPWTCWHKGYAAHHLQLLMTGRGRSDGETKLDCFAWPWETKNMLLNSKSIWNAIGVLLSVQSFWYLLIRVIKALLLSRLICYLLIVFLYIHRHSISISSNRKLLNFNICSKTALSLCWC